MKSEEEHNLNNLLVHRYQNGEDEALGLLIKKFHPTMIRTIWYYTRNREPIEDIAQDCWYSIIQKLAEIKLKISFDAWALSIVRGKSIDWIRLQQRSRMQEQAREDEAKSKINETQAEDYQDLMERIQTGIQQLSPTQ